MNYGTSHVTTWQKNILGRVNIPLTHLSRPTPKPSPSSRARLIPKYLPFFQAQGSYPFASSRAICRPSTLLFSPDSMASLSRSISKWNPVNFILQQESFQTSGRPRFISSLVGGRGQYLSFFWVFKEARKYSNDYYYRLSCHVMPHYDKMF